MLIFWTHDSWLLNNQEFCEPVVKFLVAWHQPWREYLHHRDQQTWQIRAFSFQRAGVPAHHSDNITLVRNLVLSLVVFARNLLTVLPCGLRVMGGPFSEYFFLSPPPLSPAVTLSLSYSVPVHLSYLSIPMPPLHCPEISKFFSLYSGVIRLPESPPH